MTTKRYATRDFNDAGTSRSFKAGEELTELNATQLADFELAGLAGDKPGEDAGSLSQLDYERDGLRDVPLADANKNQLLVIAAYEQADVPAGDKATKADLISAIEAKRQTA